MGMIQEKVHIRSGTLAGGVAIGASADAMTQPYGALIIGTIGGIIAVIGCTFLTPILTKKMRVHDTCGVHNVHGMPGIFAGLVAVFMAFMATEHSYGKSLYEQFPARAPTENSTELSEVHSHINHIPGGEGRSALEQATAQAAGLGLTLAMALAGGALTGFIIRHRFLNTYDSDYYFDDAYAWKTPPPDAQPLNAEPLNAMNISNLINISS